ncbi:MAG: helix-turn-helix transcriptional regulator [Aromatoleum sp.]|jgi:transcriptional regulator with XRE-family HTH domain|uniref:helix-turn-helix domain-containing protein n=1 Tax=Aromatoleum sp. TaxID=2307007 RepID=UPI0028956EE3|nr:helix-turn-helix transcriptional regulator [Aromatoleum sp.]MDT3672164.1 helix-turn-helix transcriptional regulator [Aromatoleum sp.]
MPKKTKEATGKPTRKKAKPGGSGKPPTVSKGIDTVATLKELRKATRYTQDDLAVAMGMGQGAISRIEKRDDMLVSTLQHYVESVGGSLKILVTFSDRPPLIVERLGKKSASFSLRSPEEKPAEANGQANN